MSGFNMAATGMYGLYPNLYNNQVALNDLTGLDVYPPYGMGIDPMLSMNGSIFGAYPGFGMGMGMPFMPTFTGGGYNYEDYYKNYQKYQDFMIDNGINYQEKMRNADLRLNAPQEGILKQATILHEKIMQNEQEQILQAYNAFKNSVRAMYGDNADETTGINIVKRAIEEPLRQIVENAGLEGSVVVEKVRQGEGDFGYNAREDKYENLKASGIIDPAKVTRVALENAASIAGMFLTTECVICDKKEDKPEMPMGAPGMGGMGGMM